ncbi:hypothetical protein P692DRAFT_20876411 [Suillus brevipes Sb2]|nr:hypothetical protein P692DRAFT_20876411 [Suillus brevipes Sb2]
MAPDLHVFIHEGQIFTSFQASSIPAVIPPIPRPWNPALESDYLSDNIKDALTTQWAYKLHPWFPVIPQNPVFDGAIFGDVREEWQTLEQQLTWCQGHLAVNMFLPWYCRPPQAPRECGYLRSHVDVSLAKKVALRSRDVFLGIAALCTYFIMAHQYRPHDDPDWTSLLTKDPQCPILSAWVVELSHSFVGDLTDAMPRTGMIINSAYSLSWDPHVVMFEHFKVPIWSNENPSHGGSWGDDLWGALLNDPAPAPIIQSQPDLSHFPLPKRNSGQKHGEDFKVFFARRAMWNKEKEEKETPSQRQARLGYDDDEDRFLLRHPVTKACVERIWGDYSKDTRVFDAFSNQWDLCRVLNPTSIPDGDDREDNDDIIPPFPITAPSALPPPTPSSFSWDIYKYFGNEVSLALRHASIEGLLPILPPLIGDSTAETGSIAEPQRQSITNFITLLVNSKDLDNPIPPDVWDLGPNTSLQISHVHIQVSYAELSQCRFFIIEPRQFPNHVIWTLAIPDPITAVMCLRRNWGSDLKEIALALLQRGMAFRTLQCMAIAPNLRCPLTELRTYTLGHRQLPFCAIYADYVVYEQLHHKFMNQPRARAAFLHGGLIWRLALHSLGFDCLPSILDGISP